MFNNFSSICEALSGVAGIQNVIKTSWLSTSQNWTLPSIVVDFPRLPRPTVLEDGSVLSRDEQLFVTLYVDSERHPDVTIAELETLLPLTLTTLVDLFRGKIDFGELEPIPTTFGINRNALAVPFIVTVTGS